MSETARNRQADLCLHKNLPAYDERVSHKNHKRVAVKLCGHCSPRRDMMELAEELKGSAEELTYTYYSRCPEADILLILNACEAACAEKPDFPGPVVTVTPETVDHWPVRMEEIASVVLKKLKGLKE